MNDIDFSAPHRRAGDALRALLRSRLEDAGLGFSRRSPDGRILACNAAFRRLFDAGPGSRVDGAYAEAGRAQELASRAAAGTVRGLESRLNTLDGGERWISEQAWALRDRRDRLRAVDVLSQDVTRRLAAEDGLLKAALYDPLTGLPGLGLLLDRVSQALRRMERDPERRPACLALELDHACLLRGSRGRGAWTAMLREASLRLRAGLRPEDSLCRCDGDRFYVLLESCPQARDAELVAQRLQALLRRPWSAGGEDLDLDAAIGAALAGPGQEGPDSLLRDAEAALQTARRQGRDLAFFESAMQEDAARRLLLLQGLRRAVRHDEIRAVYQPVVSLAGGKALGFEALARWRHPRMGEIPPTDFIPLAESHGEIEALGARMLELACDRAEAWRGAPDGPETFVSVNVSPRQLRSRKLPGLVCEAMARHRLGPGRLKLEITESLLMEDPALGSSQLEALAACGASLWLDDFGTGYSNLSLLSQFPIHGVKLDRSLVRGLEGSERAQALLDGVLGLARRLRLRVVAEGVENAGQARLLREAGCEWAQGYLFSRPLEEQEAGLWLHQGSLGAAPI